MTGMSLLTSSPIDTIRFCTKPSNGARMNASRSCRSASFSAALETSMSARRFFAVCSAESYDASFD